MPAAVETLISIRSRSTWSWAADVVDLHDRDDLFQLLAYLLQHGVVADDHERHPRQMRIFGFADRQAVDVVTPRRQACPRCATARRGRFGPKPTGRGAYSKLPKTSKRLSYPPWAQGTRGRRPVVGQQHPRFSNSVGRGRSQVGGSGSGCWSTGRRFFQFQSRCWLVTHLSDLVPTHISDPGGLVPPVKEFVELESGPSRGQLIHPPDKLAEVYSGGESPS